ncbi:MAG: TlpA family protein disulfide reductase [Desulfamplus sp.]|nr:TlpA family protein disulfide reductase [Desulfamplus sp.]MBF0389447.1 TlpA family protein disulfide reductase [Desulfamplus sp.]
MLILTTFKKIFIIILFTLIYFSSQSNLFASPPKVGDSITALSLNAPYSDAGKEALGLSKEATTFKLNDLKSELVILEVIGVYCPQCFKQAPEFNKLYGRLNKGKMESRVAMFALAAGGSEPEIEQLIKSSQYLFPVVSDMKYEAHKALGEPKTPFTIVCRPDGAILYVHLGIIADIDKFYGEIKSFLPKQ